MITQNGQSTFISPDKARTDDDGQSDDDNEEICVDETDDLHNDMSSANQLKKLANDGVYLSNQFSSRNKIFVIERTKAKCSMYIIFIFLYFQQNMNVLQNQVHRRDPKVLIQQQTATNLLPRRNQRDPEVSVLYHPPAGTSSTGLTSATLHSRV